MYLFRTDCAGTWNPSLHYTLCLQSRVTNYSSVISASGSQKHIRIISLTNSSVHVYLLAFFPTFFCSFVFHSRVAKNSPKSNRTKGKKNKKMNERKFEREVSSINHRIAVRFQKERRLNGAALRATFGELRIGPQNLLSAIGCSAPTETDEKGKRRERKKRKRGYFAVAGRSKILTVTSSVCAEASRKT